MILARHTVCCVTAARYAVRGEAPAPQLPFWIYLVRVSVEKLRAMYHESKQHADRERRQKRLAERHHRRRGRGRLTVAAKGDGPAFSTAAAAGTPLCVRTTCQAEVQRSADAGCKGGMADWGDVASFAGVPRGTVFAIALCQRQGGNDVEAGAAETDGLQDAGAAGQDKGGGAAETEVGEVMVQVRAPRSAVGLPPYATQHLGSGHN